MPSLVMGVTQTSVNLVVKGFSVLQLCILCAQSAEWQNDAGVHEGPSNRRRRLILIVFAWTSPYAVSL